MLFVYLPGQVPVRAVHQSETAACRGTQSEGDTKTTQHTGAIVTCSLRGVSSAQ